MTPIEGVDYSTERPDIAGLHAVGKRFACRYGGPGTEPKWLDPDEARALTANGLSIVANAEGTRTGLTGGWDAGASWATKAEAHFATCGMPPDRPIYLSVDFDVQPGQWPSVAAALRGAASVLGEARVGVYGGYDAVAWAARDKVARWYWQAAAWSEGRWHSGCHIQQYRNDVSLVGGTVDLDRAMLADYGQWAAFAVPTPPPGGTVLLTAPQDDQLADVHHATTALLDPEGGTERIPLQTWADWAAATLKTVEARLDTLIDTLVDDRALLSPKLNEVLAKLDQLVDAPLVDAVAVAAAIATNPDILGAIASGVAARLGSIEGSLSLTGSLAAGIRPPA